MLYRCITNQLSLISGIFKKNIWHCFIHKGQIPFRGYQDKQITCSIIKQCRLFQSRENNSLSPGNRHTIQRTRSEIICRIGIPSSIVYIYSTHMSRLSETDKCPQLLQIYVTQTSTAIHDQRLSNTSLLQKLIR